MPINEQIFRVIIEDQQFDHDYAVKCIEANRHNHITATYHLVHKKLLKNSKVVSDYP